jgi:hypothetical protein
MKNFFRRIQPEKPVLRNNYFIQVDDKLAWSESIGSEDADGIGWFTVSMVSRSRKTKSRERAKGCLNSALG